MCLRRRKESSNGTTTNLDQNNVKKSFSTPSVDKKENSIPLLLQPWVYFYRLSETVLPTIRLVNPFFENIDITFTIVSAIALGFLRLLSLSTLPSMLVGDSVNSDQDIHLISEISHRAVSISHSVCLCVGLLSVLLSQPYSPSAKISSAPKWHQEACQALLQFCTGYMLQDAVLTYGFLNPNPSLSVGDWCLLGHHFATSFYMVSVRVVGAGHLSAMILMFTGEFTNPLQNGFEVLQCIRLLSTTAIQVPDVLYSHLGLALGVFYSICRILLGPLAALHSSVDLMFTKAGRENVPYTGLKCFWLFLAWGVLIGSIPWIQSALEICKDYMRDGEVTSGHLFQIPGV